MNDKIGKEHIHLRPDPENMTIHMLISDIAKIAGCCAKEESDGLKLTQSSRNILFFLCHEDGLTQLDLSRLTHLKPPTISVTLRGMEQDGYVIRKEDLYDHRQTRVYVTPKGRAFDDRIKNIFDRQNAVISDALTEQECQTLKELLIKAREAIIEKGLKEGRKGDENNQT